jgi:hypothetical protein
MTNSKTYLIVYSGDISAKHCIKSWADSSPLVISWRYDMPNSMYLLSASDAGALAQNLEASLPSIAKRSGLRGDRMIPDRFLITEIASNHHGLLPAGTWNFFEGRTAEALAEFDAMATSA